MPASGASPAPEGSWTCQPFEALSGRDVHDLLSLRAAVFVVEQDCVFQDPDDLDLHAHHFLLREAGRLLACQRCLPPGTPYEESSIGRIVVAPEARGRDLGRELVKRGIDFNRRTWPGYAIRIGAQSRLTRFYESLGFRSCEDHYMEDGIEHVHMVLSAP
jgi:ElaA protein